MFGDNPASGALARGRRYHFQSDGVRHGAAAQLGGELAAEGQTARDPFVYWPCPYLNDSEEEA
jgi:hypothetical protein